jgi:adenine-specific DNA-methyltransferase
VAALYDPSRFSFSAVGFENHLNFFHRGGRGLDRDVAQGLTAFLNSSLVDAYFRQFSGHTQVNATDLRKMFYPAEDALYRLGQQLGPPLPRQEVIDRLVESVSQCSTSAAGPVPRSASTRHNRRRP